MKLKRFAAGIDMTVDAASEQEANEILENVAYAARCVPGVVEAFANYPEEDEYGHLGEPGEQDDE